MLWVLEAANDKLESADTHLDFWNWSCKAALGRKPVWARRWAWPLVRSSVTKNFCMLWCASRLALPIWPICEMLTYCIIVCRSGCVAICHMRLHIPSNNR